MVKKSSLKGENKFFFFFIIYFTFSLSPCGKKQNHLLFSPFLSSELEKPRGKTSHKIFFFFFFFTVCILPLLVIGKITTYLFFRNSDLKCPKLPLSALKFHFFQITSLSSELQKPRGKTSHKIFFFFFFFFTFLHPTAPRNRENYHLPFFSKFRLKVP